MNSKELFSFLEQPQDAPDEDFDVQEPVMVQVDTSKKRKASPPVYSRTQNGQFTPTETELAPSSLKKQRLASPKPVVVDEVEIEAKREVDASAGLTGATEAGPRLELRHQARVLRFCRYSHPHLSHRSVIK
jgi:ATP-dependent RNA helicase DOB1